MDRKTCVWIYTQITIELFSSLFDFYSPLEPIDGYMTGESGYIFKLEWGVLTFPSSISLLPTWEALAAFYGSQDIYFSQNGAPIPPPTLR